jgi:hypothetical protein
VLGLLALLYLAARITIYAVEASAVRAQHLWPRSLTNNELSEADRKQLSNIAKREERLAGEKVSVDC